MSESHRQLITRFYQAFQRLDAEAMIACYAPDVVFSDPVFGTLHGADAGDMWRMLLSRARDFSLRFDGIDADADQGQAHWVATYPFSQSGRIVVNDIQARFGFRDGCIASHHDQFDLWRWSRQALGLKGLLLGGTPWLRTALRRKALASLRTFQHQR